MLADFLHAISPLSPYQKSIFTGSAKAGAARPASMPRATAVERTVERIDIFHHRGWALPDERRGHLRVALCQLREAWAKRPYVPGQMSWGHTLGRHR